MRTIKFRGRDAVGGKGWVYGDLVHNMKVTRTGLEPRVMVGGYEVDEESIGQYTGMHDKNGKEIYEGDIVLVSDWTSVYASDYKGTVCFERGQWVVSYEKYGCNMTPRLFFDDFSDRKTTIIGNIHELPTK